MDKDKPACKEMYRLSLFSGQLRSANAKEEMVKSVLPSMVLRKDWKLAEVDPNGLLDNEEFILDNHLTKPG